MRRMLAIRKRLQLQRRRSRALRTIVRQRSSAGTSGVDSFSLISAGLTDQFVGRPETSHYINQPTGSARGCAR